MPREQKGKSPRFAISHERASLDVALTKLYSLLLETWGIPPMDYVLVDEFAYLLQGYKVQGTEIESGHIDAYVNPESIPWPDSGERSLIPPRNSDYMKQWASFMEDTGYGLDLLRARPDVLTVPTVDYPLPNGKCIRLMRAYEMTEQFAIRTLMHYSLSDVGTDKVREWHNKLQLIQGAALENSDDRLIELCTRLLVQSSERWAGVL